MTPQELQTHNANLDAELLKEAESFDPARLHEAPEGEWSAAQVLAHLGEFPRFFAGQLRAWQADRDTVLGRTHEHPARLAAVADSDRQESRRRHDELVAGAEAALAELAAALEGLTGGDLSAATQNVKYGAEPMTAFLERYVTGHKAGHLDQLRRLRHGGDGHED